MSKIVLFSTAVCALGAGMTAAQISGTNDMSKDCATAFAKILGSNFATCSNVQGLLSVITTRPDESLVQPLEKYIGGMKICADSDLAIVKAEIAAGCTSASDQSQPTVIAIQQIASNYNDIYSLLTTNDHGQLCIPSILESAETSSNKKFSASNLQSLLGGNAKGLLDLLSNLDTSVYCNKCGQGLASKLSVLAEKTPETASSADEIKTSIDSKCGAGFTPSNGTLPEGITDGNNSAAAALFVNIFTIGLSLTLVSFSLYYS